MLGRRTRILLCLTPLLLTAVAVSQQPVQSPYYLLSSAPSLELGVPVGGALTPASGRNFKDGSYLDVLILRATAGEGIEVLVESDAFDTYLSVFDPVGSLVASNDDAWDVSDAWYASRVTFEAARQINHDGREHQTDRIIEENGRQHTGGDNHDRQQTFGGMSEA